MRRDDIDAEPWLAEILETFQPFKPEDPEGAHMLADWLAQKALDDYRDTWLLLDGQVLIAFHTAEPGKAVAEVGDESAALVESVHCQFAARSADDAARGAGQAISDHLVELAREAGLPIATLDPLDVAIAAVWKRTGFSDSFTYAEEEPSRDDGVWRQFRPA